MEYAPSQTRDTDALPIVVDGEGMYSVDDEGNVIDPAAEGSCLMAERLASEGLFVFSPYEPNPDDVERQRDAIEFLASYTEEEALGVADVALKQAEEEEEAEGDGAKRHSSLGNGDYIVEGKREKEAKEEDEEEEEYVCCDEDEACDDDDGDTHESMGAQILTDPDDWVLEAIQRRKINKAREGGPWIYYCKWKGYDVLTWETREVMEDAGWIPQLDAFDAREALGNPKASKRRVVRRARRRPSSHSQLIKAFFGETDEAVAAAIVAKGCKIHHYAEMNTALATRFYNAWSSRKETHVPTLLFHGTRPENLPSIYKNGLLAGGTNGISVANGSAHGQGVYTAKRSDVSSYYARTSCSVIVCAGLVPVQKGDETVVKIGDFVVFRDPTYVYPMWIVQYDGHTDWFTEKPTAVPFAERFFLAANTGFGRYAPLNPKTFDLFEACPLPLPSPSPLPSQQQQHAGLAVDVKNEVLTESEKSRAIDALRELKGSMGGFKKSALRAQPRRIKDLLARLAKEQAYRN